MPNILSKNRRHFFLEMASVAATNVSMSSAEPPLEVVAVDAWKIKTIFNRFCNQEGYLGYDEFRALDSATEEDGGSLNAETFLQICHFLCAQNPTKGLSLVEYASIYLNEQAAATFESDLNADFAAVFPEHTKVAMIFEAFDTDGDGYLSAIEFSNLVDHDGGEGIHLDWKVQQARLEAFHALGKLFSFQPEKGMSIYNLVDFYLTEKGTLAGFEPDIDGDVSMAAKMMGVDELAHATSGPLKSD